MTKTDKLIQKVIDGKTISTSEALKLLSWLGYDQNTSKKGSHATFRKAGKASITIVLTYKDIPTYTLDRLQNALEENKDE